jgi:hypothetical protein
MKRFEPKTFAWLTLPALVLLFLAWILNLRDQKRDFGPPYRITRHEVVREHAMTEREKQIARICKLPQGRAVVYRYEIKPRRVSFLEEHLLDAANTGVWGNGSSCREEVTKLAIAPKYSSGTSMGDGSAKWMEIYDVADIDDHPVVFSFPLTWAENGKAHTRTVTKRIVAQELK